ncbi:MAG: TIM44-like domain-containing protein [Devosia sp.]
MLGSRWFRLSALFAVLLTAFSLTAVGTAEARFGGSFGSRGTRTYQSIPATPTVPYTTSGVQRSTGAYAPGYGANSSGFGRGIFGGLGGWLLGGLLFSGLFGMMFGGGFGGIGGLFSLLIQVGILYLVVRWLFRRFAPAGGPSAGSGFGGGYGFARQDGYSSPGAGFGSGPGATSSRGGKDEIGISNADLNLFEARLKQLQDAYSREDYDALRRISTPEIMSYLTEELAQAAAKGLRNEVFDVRLISGDIAEAWREGNADYATAALRYESRDVMRNRATGELVSGEDRIVERSEVWTFVRHNRGEWFISAIQGA